MDPEEKELLKKLLNKVDNLEKQINTQKKENEALQEEINRTQQKITKKKTLKFQPLPPGTDRFTRICIDRARKKALQKADQMKQKEVKVRVEDLKKNYSFSELARFAIKKRMLKEGKESSEIREDDVLKVYED